MRSADFRRIYPAGYVASLFNLRGTKSSRFRATKCARICTFRFESGRDGTEKDATKLMSSTPNAVNIPLVPPPADSDYFEVFGLPRKLWIETVTLEQKFLQLSWKLHPDNFVNASEEQRELSLKRSSKLNDAYRVLRDPVARLEYLLEIEGQRKEGEKKQQAPPELLEEVFELNESLDELREARQSGENLGELKTRLQSAENGLKEKLDEVDTQLQCVAKDWDAAVDGKAGTEARKKLFSRMNELLNRRSYIRNLVANVFKELDS